MTRRRIDLDLTVDEGSEQFRDAIGLALRLLSARLGGHQTYRVEVGRVVGEAIGELDPETQLEVLITTRSEIAAAMSSSGFACCVAGASSLNSSSG